MGESSGGGGGVSRVGGVFAEDVMERVERSRGEFISSSSKWWAMMAIKTQEVVLQKELSSGENCSPMTLNPVHGLRRLSRIPAIVKISKFLKCERHAQDPRLGGVWGLDNASNFLQ